ncbi:rod shape-determining protein [Sporomusa malonica]|uniref:Uncharacterized protein n=1 Tax=Sporomusa malonica TaxID=112901 RepID=A0A1W2BD68_9FIRM|nr:rod shape-determining protein [Sporomusa malonica]SMC70846.1 hypothetical protein SAMN04488500_10795 [Sporomusa malonica]
MAGRLVIDFGNAYTVAAYWRQVSRQAETLYVPGVMRPIRTSTDRNGKAVYAAPALILYGGAAEEYLIGQEVAENLSGLTDDRKIFSNLKLDIITGKRVYSAAGGRRLSGQEIARDYIAAVISRAGQALGLGSEAVITFTVPVAACMDEAVWQRYRSWLAGAVRQAGFTRMELVEHPWAAAWGAGMRIKPEDRYLVLDLDAGIVEAAVVQAGHSLGCDERQLRVLSHVREWLMGPTVGQASDNECANQLETILQQTLRQAARLGYAGDDLAGVIVTGDGGQQLPFKQGIHDFFVGIPIYDKRLLDAAACGAAALTAGFDACGYIRHNYGLRYLDQDHYQYRLLTVSGTFYPSDGPVAELTIRAGYEGQQEYALFIYRLEQGGSHCINEDSPLIITTGAPASSGQAAIQASISIDGAGQLVVTAYEVGSKQILVNNAPAAKLM